jgi:tripartite-type tricarboxylate transporter receptor subunit TctC
MDMSSCASASSEVLLTFGGTAVGTSGYLAAQLFNQRAGTNLAIAPHPSTAQATIDPMTGRISIAFASAANVLQLIEEGKLTAFTVAQTNRAATHVGRRASSARRAGLRLLVRSLGTRA